MREVERQARERLRAAIADLSEKRELQAITETAVGRATRLRDIAQADYDDAVAARTHAALASARKVLEPVFGADAPSPDVLPLPVHVAQEQLDASLAALKLLTEESDRARTAVLTAEADVQRRAAEVIDALVEVFAERLLARQQEAAQLRNQLLGLSHVWQAGADVSRPWPLNDGVRKALTWSEPQYVPGTEPVRAATKGWQEYYLELQTDPDAGLISLPEKEAE